MPLTPMPSAPSRRRYPVALVVLALLAAAPGCRRKQPPAPPPAVNFSEPLPPGQLALRKISPAEYPDFSAAFAAQNLPDLRRSIDHSLKWLARPSSRRAYPYLDVTHDRAAATLRELKALLEPGALEAAGGDANLAVAERFEVYKSVGAPKPDNSGYTGKVLFTGYFTPTYEASLTRGGPYQWPLYKRPADLIADERGEGAARRAPDAEDRLAGRPAYTEVPYYSRREIGGEGKLAGQELVWLTSRWEAYVVTIQGSARLRLPDRRIYEVGFAGTNGLEYTSPARAMSRDGVIREQDITFETLRTYFDAHPEAMDKYLWLNDRTVFFAERPGGPFGSLNVPVTAFATIATDKDVYPPAMPAFVDVPAGAGAAGRSVRGFMLDQDRGGAIRSAGRCDVYMGIGESAEQTAGRQLSEGELYYLAVKPEVMR